MTRPRSNARSGGRPRNPTRQRRRRQIRQGGAAESSSSSTRRQTITRTGKLDADSAIAALKDMGFTVDRKGRVNTAEARQVAEGAAIAAATALGVDIRKPNGKIDTAKAQGAISQMLGLAITPNPSQAEKAAQNAAVERAQQAAIAAGQAMGVDIRDANGGIDTAKAQQVTDVALDLKTVQAQQLGRREAVESLNTSLDAMTATPASRRAASEAMEKLLSSSVLVDGKIDRRQAIAALNQKLSQP